MRLTLLASVSLSLLTVMAHATPLHVSSSGTFTSTTPTSTISAPSGTFSLSFNIDSMPTVTSHGTTRFDISYSNFSFLLNGVSNLTPVGSITFFDQYVNQAPYGQFQVCFLAVCPAGSPAHTLIFTGDQLFTGPVSAPTILTGSFTPIAASVSTDASFYSLQSVSSTSITSLATSAAPEPSSLLLFGTGLLSAAGVAKRKLLRNA